MRSPTIVIALLAAALAHAASAESRACKNARAALNEIEAPDATRGPPDGEKHRFCIKSYPWPNGTQFEDVKSAAAMGVILAQNEALFAEWKTRPPRVAEARLLQEASRDGAKDERLIKVLVHRSFGDDFEQGRLFGEALRALLLFREKQYSAARAAVAALAARGVLLKPAAPSWDELDEHTYFSIPTLSNLLLLVDLASRAQLASTRPQALDLLAEYTSRPQVFAPLRDFLDPGPRLLRVLGCAAVDE
jgi:hypothetical protein